MIARIKFDRPKLYGLVLEHMSVKSKVEVAQEEDYDTWHKAADPEKLWQAIMKMHKGDCVRLRFTSERSHSKKGIPKQTANMMRQIP